MASTRPRSNGSSASSKTTTNHNVIRKWVEARGGHPATVKDTGARSGAGVLRIDYPGYRGKELKEISWDTFFEKFDEKNLAFLYQDKTATGKTSRFSKLVSRASKGRKK